MAETKNAFYDVRNDHAIALNQLRGRDYDILACNSIGSVHRLAVHYDCVPRGLGEHSALQESLRKSSQPRRRVACANTNPRYETPGKALVIVGSLNLSPGWEGSSL